MLIPRASIAFPFPLAVALAVEVAILGCASSSVNDVSESSPNSLVRIQNTKCVAPARPTVATGLRLSPAFGNVQFDKPVAMVPSPIDPDRFFVVEQTGIVRTLRRGDTSSKIALDFRSRVDSVPQEAGLLGIAFHPNATTNREVFLFHTPRENGVLVARITRVALAADGTTLDASRESLIFRQPLPFDNHHGGHIAFGPDGMLYAALGDGGGAGDPLKNGQNKSSLLGKFLRFDVDGGSPYRIPDDNPFAKGGGRGEIWAYGFRNPWRFSFDRTTGDLFAGDVGQDAREEVDIVTRGGNYGWSVVEGTRCNGAASACADPTLNAPVAEYERSQGISITGGFVYRGSNIAGLNGTYLFGDFGSGTIWGLSRSGDSGKYAMRTLLGASGKNISSFAEDTRGELYVLGWTDGSISRIDPVSSGPTTSLPARLSETGCMAQGSPSKPGPALVAYSVNAPLWSDGADKERWLALPDGKAIAVGENGNFELPKGAVLIKQFRVAGRLVETRFFVRHDDGGYGGYTYVWSADQTDAVLAPDAATVNLGGGKVWKVPSRGECMQCHTAAADTVLGFRTEQINRDFPTPGPNTGNQIDTLAAAGFFSRNLGPARNLPSLPNPFGTASVPDRARAYLDGNCSNCHRPGGTGRGSLDLRYSTPFAAQGLCDALPSMDALGIADARILAPGDPNRSVLRARMARRGPGQMPPLASASVHGEATALIESFISGIRSCPTDARRTVVFVQKQTSPGQTLVLRGGIDHERARAIGRTCTTTNYACSLPITQRIAQLGSGDAYLDWYGAEPGQAASVFGSPLAWTTKVWTSDLGPYRSVVSDGFGVTPLNRFGAHYWLFDVDMDCSRTLGGSFELKAFVTNGDGWEPDVAQSNAPYATPNHVAQCGKLNVFRFGESSAQIENLP
jgi:uncharacterized repeat protein (TIGR03806 family)